MREPGAAEARLGGCALGPPGGASFQALAIPSFSFSSLSPCKRFFFPSHNIPISSSSFKTPAGHTCPPLQIPFPALCAQAVQSVVRKV